MSKVDRQRFIEFVKRSGLVEESVLSAALERAPVPAPLSPLVGPDAQGSPPLGAPIPSGNFENDPAYETNSAADGKTEPSAANDSPARCDAEAKQLADWMVEQRLINRWQADHLLGGKYKGFMLGKYRLLGHLGTGGMSSVYLAEHPVMERRVAIKVLPRKNVKNPNYLDRFRREARAVASMDHPNIVRAYDIDNDGDTHFIVMEYVEGRDLQRIVDQDGPAPIDFAADCIGQVAVGLDYAHRQGLIHRDIKPANCLVDTQATVKILDLGLAKFSAEERPALSSIYNDNVVGTADYLAPEQAVNSQTVDSRADIYSLGCTLYFLLTGHPPFPTGTLAERLLKHQSEVPQSIYKSRPDSSPALVDICQRMMTKDKDLRYQSAAEVANALSAFLKSRRKEPPKWESIPQPESGAGKGIGFGGIKPFPAKPGVAGLGAMTPPPARSPSDSKIGSSVNEDLALAPLDEEHVSSSDLLGRVLASKRGGSDRLKSHQKDSDLRGRKDVDSLRNILTPLDRPREPESDPSVMRRLSPRRKKEILPAWGWFAIGAGLLFFLFLVMFLAGNPDP
ncbi:MAG: serine/threonine-protein kinase [Planctomycetota bacterium]|nr:serine/threonine-protein kinase [Planctomycetota bacterium]